MQSILLRKALLRDDNLLPPQSCNMLPLPSNASTLADNDGSEAFARTGAPLKTRGRKYVQRSARIVSWASLRCSFRFKGACRSRKSFVVRANESADADPLLQTWSWSLISRSSSEQRGPSTVLNSAAASPAARSLNVSQHVILLDTALFLIGMGIAASIVEPLSEIACRCA